MRQRTPIHGQENTVMVWHTSITSQRLAPRGEVAAANSGRPVHQAHNKKNFHPGGWRG